MSQTDSLEDHFTSVQPADLPLHAVAQQLQLPLEALRSALVQIAESSPASSRISLQLLQALITETAGWKAEPQARLLGLILAPALARGGESPVVALQHALDQRYPELFTLESSQRKPS